MFGPEITGLLNLDSSIDLKPISSGNINIFLQAIKLIQKNNYKVKYVATLKNCCLNFTLCTLRKSTASKIQNKNVNNVQAVPHLFNLPLTAITVTLQSPVNEATNSVSQDPRDQNPWAC